MRKLLLALAALGVSAVALDVVWTVAGRLADVVWT